jgi:glycosyltransferase involved in cell wall biosynthesis
MSLVIPAHKEETYLPSLLDSVELARGRYRLGADAVEVIVAYNASTDETADIARSWGCRVVYVKRRRIAAARNGGAAGARGDVLAFVDADSRIHPETFNALDDALGSISTSYHLLTLFRAPASLHLREPLLERHTLLVEGTVFPLPLSHPCQRGVRCGCARDR